MLRIKSAQYMTGMPMPAKPMSDIAPCKLCQESKYADDLSEGFCQECLASGMVKSCINCQAKGTEDEMSQTNDGWICPTCAEDLYSGQKYTGPRREYFSGPAELY